MLCQKLSECDCQCVCESSPKFRMKKPNKSSRRKIVNRGTKKSLSKQLVHDKTMRIQIGARILADSLSFDELLATNTDAVRAILSNKKIRVRYETKARGDKKTKPRIRYRYYPIVDNSMRVHHMQRFLQAIRQRALEMEQTESSLAGIFGSLSVAQPGTEKETDSIMSTLANQKPSELTFEEQMAAMKVE